MMDTPEPPPSRWKKQSGATVDHDQSLIISGGIADLCLGLTLHQIGVPFHIFETSREIKPLGVDINLQPSAVRELIDLGLHQVLMDIGI
mgnify:CR=1 FL=1